MTSGTLTMCFIFNVWYVYTFPVITSELPAMEGTLEAVASYKTPGRQICTHVRAVGVQDLSAPILASKYGQIQAYNYT